MTAYKVGIVGQSFAQGLLAPAATGVMREEMARAGYTLQLFGHGVGGCAMLKENAPSGNPDAWLWDVDNSLPGPALLAMESALSAAAPIYRVGIDTGSQEGVVSPTFDPARWRTAAEIVISRLKNIANPGGPAGVAVFMNVVGRLLTTGTAPGVQIMRETTLDFIADGKVNFWYDMYDLPLLGEDTQYPSDTANRHFTPVGNASMGYRAIQRVLLSLSKPYRFGPRMTALSREDSDTIRCTIYCETGFSKPADPSHFAVRDWSGNLTHSPDLDFTWDGNDLLISKTGGLPAGDLLFPYGELNTLDREGLMYDVRHIPLQSLKKEIPA